MAKKSNLDIALNNVEQAFREGKKAGVTVEKESWRNDTYATYEKETKTMLRDMAENVFGGDADHKRLLPKFMNGKTWDKYFDHLANRYEKGEITADTVQKRVHAVEAFRSMVNNTNVLGRDTTIRVGNKEERLDYLKERGVAKSQNEVTAMKPKEWEVEKVHNKIDRSTPNGDTSYQINKLQTETGGRIKSVFKLEVKDVDFKNNTLTFRNDKNNFSRTIPLSEGARNILVTACAGKSDGSPVFTMKDRNGNDLNQKQAVKTVQKHTNDAAKASGVNRENRRYVTHSNRKFYAQNLYNSTKKMTEKELQKSIGEYIRMQGSNKEKITERIKSELDRINAYRSMKGYPKQGFTHEHLRRLYTSLHLGHSRCDVVVRYIKPDARLISKAS